MADLERVEQRLTHLAASWMVGWDQGDVDPIRQAYQQTWTEAARRLCRELVDLGIASKAARTIALGDR